MRRCSTTFVILVLLAFPAHADPEIPPGQDGGPNKPRLIEYGNFFLPIAKTFGCNEFRWAAYGKENRSMNLEYVPAGDDLNKWTRLMTVTTYVLPESADAQRDAMMKIQGGAFGDLL